MTEQQVGYLSKAVASLPNVQNSRPLTLLRSYYLMKCKGLSSGYGLPGKIFSPKARCSHCFTEWRRGTPITVRAIKLSKRQRRNIRALNAKEDKKPYVKRKLKLLNSKKMELLCDFCKQSTVIIIPKPEKISKDINTSFKEEKNLKKEKRSNVAETKTTVYNKSQSKHKKTQKKVNEINVYRPAKDVFSISKKNNVLAASIKEAPKVIKNNKKKKEKYAGLCAKAVLATAKLKEENEKQNKIKLFLKPSA